MQCPFEIKGAGSRDEVMQLAAVHAKATHQMESVAPELAQKIGAAIKE
jgi:predicted small metal-binding protein